MQNTTLLDGVDIYTAYGVVITEDGYGPIVGYPPLKEPEKNNWPEQDGAEVDLTDPQLDSRQVSIRFATIGTGDTGLRQFVAALSDGAYHTFTFNQLGGKTCSLRLTAAGEIKLTDTLHIFKLDFADDFPLPGYTYQAPTGGLVSQVGYAIDWINLSDYGVIVLAGNDAEIMKPPKVKKNNTIEGRTLPGLIYDGENVQYESKEVTLRLVLVADSMAQFWRNYNALIFDLTRPGIRTFQFGRTAQEFECYYKRSEPGKFYTEGKIWLEFRVVLEFTNYRLQ